MHDDEPLVLESAGRHGIDPEDALHAWVNAIDLWRVDEGMAMYIGTGRAGLLLEVGVVEWHDTIAIVHAMRARTKFLR